MNITPLAPWELQPRGLCCNSSLPALNGFRKICSLCGYKVLRRDHRPSQGPEQSHLQLKGLPSRNGRGNCTGVLL